jgi:hypothetical protein
MAKAFGGKPGVDGLSDEVKLALFKAGVPANSVVVIQGDPFETPDLMSDQMLEWQLFGSLLETKLKWSKDAVAEHLNWVIYHQGFKTPDEWLGEDGTQYRRRWGMPQPSDRFKQSWRDFRDSQGDSPPSPAEREAEDARHE